jgi:hypothetical protein
MLSSDLTEFQTALQKSRQAAFITADNIEQSTENDEYLIFTVAAFQGGKSKLDELYLQDFSTQERMKNILSNMLFKGNSVGSYHSNMSLGQSSQNSNTDDDSISIASEPKSPITKTRNSTNKKGHHNHNHSHSHSRSHSQPIMEEIDMSPQQHHQQQKQITHTTRSATTTASEGEGRPSSVNIDEDVDEKEVAAASAKAAAHATMKLEQRQQLQEKGGYSTPDIYYVNDDNKDDANIMEEVENDETNGMMAMRKTIQRDHQIIEDKQQQYFDAKDDLIMEENLQIIQRSYSFASDTSSNHDDWNNLTTVKDSAMKIFPFVSLVCIPRPLQASICWGLPRQYIQFTNHAKHNWKMEIHWIDEQGALIPRHEVKGGTTHFELCSDEHVWAIVAVPLHPHSSNNTNKNNTVSKSVDNSLEDGISNQVFAGSESLYSTMPEHQYPLLFVLKPSKAALQDGKCVTMIWTPWLSLSVSQSLHPHSMQTMDSNLSNQRIQPVIHFQLLEPSNNVLQSLEQRFQLQQEKKYSEFQEKNSAGEQDDRTHGSNNSSIESSTQASFQSLRRTVDDYRAANRSIDRRLEMNNNNSTKVGNGAKINKKPLITTKSLYKMMK